MDIKPKSTRLPQNGILRKILGVLTLCLGIVGLFLPFLQGILLISLGLSLLGVYPRLHTNLMTWGWFKRWQRTKK